MAQKYLDGEGLKEVKKHYDVELEKKVNTVVGKSLVSDEEISKLLTVKENANPNTIEGIQINGTDLVPDVESKKVNITAKDLAPDLEGYATDQELEQALTEYTKTTELADSEVLTNKFLDKTEAQATYANKNDIPKIQIPTCTQEELEGKKATAVDGDRVVVTDEEYHIYIYVGETGTGEWKDTGTHVNLSDYVQKDGDKVLVSPEDVTQITTNKNEIETLKSGKANTTDLPTALSTEEINQILQGTE